MSYYPKSHDKVKLICKDLLEKANDEQSLKEMIKSCDFNYGYYKNKLAIFTGNPGKNCVSAEVDERIVAGILNTVPYPAAVPSIEDCDIAILQIGGKT